MENYVVFATVCGMANSCVSTIMSNLSTLPYLILRFFGFYAYVVHKSDNITKIIKFINKKSAMIDDNNNPLGLFITYHGYDKDAHKKFDYAKANIFRCVWAYFAYLYTKYVLRLCVGISSPDKVGGSVVVTMMTSKYIYKHIIKEKKVPNKKTDNVEAAPVDRIIKYYYRRGTYSWLCYNQRKVTNRCLTNPTEEQSCVIDQIIKLYKESITKSCVIYLYGKPGTGKSSIPYFLASGEKYKGQICKTFNPTEPGDTLDLLYIRADPTKKKPLIINLEEVDIIIKNVHNQTIPQHKDIPTLMKNKSDWNTFMDDFNVLYPFTILIMTSNVSKECIDSIDESYLREGRINACFELTNVVNSKLERIKKD